MDNPRPESNNPSRHTIQAAPLRRFTWEREVIDGGAGYEEYGGDGGRLMMVKPYEKNRRKP